MRQSPPVTESSASPAPRIAASVADLQRMASATRAGLIPVYSDGRGLEYVPSTPVNNPRPGFGTQEILNLSDELLLIRTDWRNLSKDFLRENRWAYDHRGWLYLHCRLDGISEECTPDGRQRSFDGECFLLSASTCPRPFARDVLGDSWRTVGIACRPSFVLRDVPIAGSTLPVELRRFQTGDPDVDFFYAGRLTREMKSAVTTLLYPHVQGSVRPLYLQAKVVELVCLALDRLDQPESEDNPTLRLTRRDLVCLQTVQRMLRDCINPPSLAELARRVGLNRRKLAVGFKQVVGVTVGAYHRERRLDVARELLERGSASIGRAAAMAGYADAGSFSKAFRTRHGYLPSELKGSRVSGLARNHRK